MGELNAKVFSFDLGFTGGKKTRFYRELFGFKSKTTTEDKRGKKKVYEKFYPGLITPIPHLPLGKSVFAVPQEASDEVLAFFEDPKWEPAEVHVFDANLPPDDRYEAMERTLERIQIFEDRSLREELDYLEVMARKGDISKETLERAEKTTKAVEKVLQMDWTEDLSFSESIREELELIKK